MALFYEQSHFPATLVSWADGGVGVPATDVQESWESQRFFIVLLFERMVMVLSLPRKIMVSWLGGW